MLGLFGTLQLGTRSLQTQQAGVEVAGHNLANINNPAYSRQRLLVQTSPTVDTSFGPQGTGAMITGIQQARDLLLDGLVRDELSVGGYWGAYQNALQLTESSLNEFLSLSTSGIDNPGAGSGVPQGLSHRITTLFTAFDGVAANPLSIERRQALVNEAASLAEAFRQTDGQLGAIDNLLNGRVEAGIQQANSLLLNIAELNRQIASVELRNGPVANDLRDLRRQKLEELSHLASIATTEEPDGTISVSIGATSLVTRGEITEGLETYDPGDGNLQVRFAGSGVPAGLKSGSIQGAIDARDGTLTSLRTGLNTLAAEMISQVNAIYSEGYDLEGGTGANFFIGTGISTIDINPLLLSKPSAVQAAGAPGSLGDNTVARRLAQLGPESLGALGGQDFAGAYGQVVTQFGQSVWNANQQVANHEAVGAMLANQRDSIGGVSMEEELTSLMAYQKAYQASARIITTVDEMLETLLSLKR